MQLAIVFLNMPFRQILDKSFAGRYTQCIHRAGDQSWRRAGQAASIPGFIDWRRPGG